MQESRTTSAVMLREFWMQAESPEPWLSRGKIPLLALFFLYLIGALFQAPRIEADVKERVSDRLMGAGVQTSVVEVDGQEVIIRASAGETNEGFLQSVASSTQCATWAGSLECPASIAIELDKLPATAQPAPQPRPHKFVLYRQDDGIVLSGEVPTQADRERVVQLAGQISSSVSDQLTVSAEPAMGEFASSTDIAMGVLSHLLQGQVTWSGRALSVIGFANAESIPLAERRFDETEALGIRGDYNVSVITPPDQCNERFESLLSGSEIRFRTGSAIIERGNEPLLQAVAQLASSCPGLLTIEGHTDSQGAAETNKSLSYERATAVRVALGNLGVNLDRVAAVGYGEERPIADNTTSEGRARNRRIAIVVGDEVSAEHVPDTKE